MKLTFVKPELTCVNLEQELGLERGVVQQITVQEGMVEIELGCELSSEQKTARQSLLGGMVEKTS